MPVQIDSYFIRTIGVIVPNEANNTTENKAIETTNANATSLR